MTLHEMPLTYGCVAVIITEDSDRLPYVPPPIARDEHATDTCGCPDCVMLRERKARGAA